MNRKLLITAAVIAAVVLIAAIPTSSQQTLPYEIGRYQITATSYSIGSQMDYRSKNADSRNLNFTQVFRVDTATGEVCQVVGAHPVPGESASITSIPLCPLR